LPLSWNRFSRVLMHVNLAGTAPRRLSDQGFPGQESSRAADSKPSLALEKYAGLYTDAWYGPSTVRYENGNLIMTLDHTPRAIADLQHWQYNTFKAHWRDRTIEDAFITFALQPDGAIDHFTMKAVSPLADFSFDYQDLYFQPAKGVVTGIKRD